MTLPRQGGRDPSRPGACHRGHGCVPTGKPTQNILRANAPHTYRTRRTYTTHTLSCRLVGARAGLAPRRQAKWRGIRMNDSPLACLKGEPERAAPARARHGGSVSPRFCLFIYAITAVFINHSSLAIFGNINLLCSKSISKFSLSSSSKLSGYNSSLLYF